MYEPLYKCVMCGAPLRSGNRCEPCGARFQEREKDRLKYTPWGLKHLECKDRHNRCYDGSPYCLCSSQLKYGLPEPTRHCSYCGIGTCEDGKSKCGKCDKSPMTIDRAVEVLNKHRHECDYVPSRQRDEWCVVGGYVKGPDIDQVLTEFEAIAIAEKYERESGNDR